MMRWRSFSSGEDRGTRSYQDGPSLLRDECKKAFRSLNSHRFCCFCNHPPSTTSATVERPPRIKDCLLFTAFRNVLPLARAPGVWRHARVRALQAAQQVDLAGVVATLAPARARARLLRGTLDKLGFENVPVAIGTDGGFTKYSSAAFEKTSRSYIAPDDDTLNVTTGFELLVRLYESAPANGLELLAIASLKDIALFIRSYEVTFVECVTPRRNFCDVRLVGTHWNTGVVCCQYKELHHNGRRAAVRREY